MDRVLQDFSVGVSVTDSMRVCSVIAREWPCSVKARVWLCLQAVFERSSCGWIDFSCNRIELRTNKFKQVSDVGLWLVGCSKHSTSKDQTRCLYWIRRNGRWRY